MPGQVRVPLAATWLMMAAEGPYVEVASPVHVATAILVPWPAAIGYRRFYQGVLARHGLARRVA